MTDSVPEKLGKYKIIKEVGRGGFADVYRAIDTTLDRTVALKFLEPRLLREPTFVERFQREAKLAANLKHPNIVFIHEFGWEAGTVYLAMEFLEGRTLKEVISQEGALSPRRIVNMVGQIASALDYAHGRGLVHRDIKPSNIMVGANDHVTVMDFGIAKAATQTALTTTGRIFGTPEYMSPEQAEGVEEPEARSDVYSLGVVVYEMLTGKVPFSGTVPLSIMRGHADKPPPPPSEIKPDVTPAVEAVLLKALAKKRGERYQSAGEMAVALQQAVSGAVVEGVKAPLPVVAPPEMPSLEAERALAPARLALLWRWVAGVGAAVVVVVALIIALTSGGGPITKPTSTPTAAALAPTATPTTSSKIPLPKPTEAQILPTPTPVPPPPTPTPTARPTPISTLEATEGPVALTVTDIMIEIPAGPFTIGNDAGADDEAPAHEVDLPAFLIDEFEVTNADFAQFVEATGYQTDAEKARRSKTWRGAAEGKDNHPVVFVSWNDAVAYCEWLGKRLPSEAEWEKAARGTDGRMYPWGNDWDATKANVKDTGLRGTAAVGSFGAGASPYEVEDMAGNVWEWTADWYEAYPGSDYQSDYFGQRFRVLRGGAWFETADFVRTAVRNANSETAANDDLGFRCAR